MDPAAHPNLHGLEEAITLCFPDERVVVHDGLPQLGSACFSWTSVFVDQYMILQLALDSATALQKLPRFNNCASATAAIQPLRFSNCRGSATAAIQQLRFSNCRGEGNCDCRDSATAAVHQLRFSNCRGSATALQQLPR